MGCWMSAWLLGCDSFWRGRGFLCVFLDRRLLHLEMALSFGWFGSDALKRGGKAKGRLSSEDPLGVWEKRYPLFLLLGRAVGLCFVRYRKFGMRFYT